MSRPTKEEMQARMAHAREVARQKRDAEVVAAIQRDEDSIEDPTEALELSEHTWLGEKGKSLYIPAWYKPHRINVPVTQNGKSLGFKVKDVMPHRRWAIRGDGELLDQRDFEPYYEKYIGEIAAKGVDPRLQHIPQVKDFVNVKEDPSGGPGYVEILFENKPELRVDDGMRYDPVKDVIFSVKNDLERSARLEKVEALARMLAKNEITGEVFQREMRELSPDVEIESQPTTAA